MTKVEVLEEQIEKLTPEEWVELRDWFLDRDAHALRRSEGTFSRFPTFEVPDGTPTFTVLQVQQALDEDGIV